MKSKSPFPMKSPLRIQTYGGDTYESPDTVITRRNQVSEAITGLADVGAKYMDLKGKLAKDKSDHGKAMELANLKYGKKTNGEARLGLTTPSKVGGSFGEVPGVPDLVSNSQTTPNSNSNESSTFTKIVKEVLPYGTNYQGQKMSDDDWNKLDAKQKRAMNANVGANEEGIIGHNGYRILEINKKNNNVASSSGANFNGSPNKLIGDTMDPYGQINPGQPSARAIDMAAIGNPYATPGADFDPQSKMKAESIFGSAGQRQGLMNLGTPLHTKGHEGDFIKDHKHSTESKNPATPKYINGDPSKTADKLISSTDEPRRLKKNEIGPPTEREQSDRDYLAKFDMEYKASGGNLYVPKKR